MWQMLSDMRYLSDYNLSGPGYTAYSNLTASADIEAVSLFDMYGVQIDTGSGSPVVS